MCVYVYVCMCVYVYVWMCVCVYMCMCVCLSVCLSLESEVEKPGNHPENPKRRKWRKVRELSTTHADEVAMRWSKYRNKPHMLTKLLCGDQNIETYCLHWPDNTCNGSGHRLSEFWRFFGPVFFQSQICIDFLLLFCKICVVFQKPTFKFHAPTQCFVALHTV